MKIKLTKFEAEIVEWAFDPLTDCWCTENGCYERDGEMMPESDLPRIKDGILYLSDNADINDDLNDRLTEQLWSMSDEAGGYYQNGGPDAERMEAVRTQGAIRRIAKKCGWDF